MKSWKSADALQSLTKHYILSLITAYLILCLPLEVSSESGLAAKLSSISKRAPSTKTSVSVIDLSNGQPVFEKNESLPLKPASILKVITSAVAYKKLGPEYRFKTEVFVNYSKTPPNLVIRGNGDPHLTSEVLWSIARKVQAHGIKSVGDVVVDATRFSDPAPRKGQRAFEAGTSAVAFNFNSVTFYVCPGPVGGKARVSVDPWEYGVKTVGSISTVSRGGGTFGIDEITNNKKSSGAPTFRLKGKINSSPKCSEKYRSVADPLSYFMQSWQSLLQKVGIKINGQIRSGVVTSGSKLLFEHESRPLSQVIFDLNRFSSNFIANQILTVLGETTEGFFERELGLIRMGSYLKALGFAPESFRLVDASGLSHDNRITASMVSRVLRELYLDETIRPEFINSLSVSARSGTLEKRKFGNGTFVRAKTGTINGVTSLAGYLKGSSGKSYAFVVIQNNLSYKQKALNFEKMIVQALSNS